MNESVIKEALAGAVEAMALGFGDVLFVAIGFLAGIIYCRWWRGRWKKWSK